MKTKICFLSLLSILLFNVKFACADNWIIVPGKSLGPITRDTSEQKLIELFGSENVKRIPESIGEGAEETQTVTTIFPNDPTKTATIYWSDSKTRNNPIGIAIEAKSHQQNSLWRTNRGISIGMSLKELEALNGKPFRLFGFGWENGGLVCDNNGGRLIDLGVETKTGVTRTLAINFSPNTRLEGTDVYNSVVGERDFLSDNPAMQEINPHIERIGFSFIQN